MGVNPRDISVVVCTADRPAVLRACLRSLRQEGATEVVVVRHEADAATAAVLEAEDGVVVTTTGRRNVSAARNVGIAAATGAVVAFVDDDATVRPGWLAAIAAGFYAPDVGAVGGIVIDMRCDPPVVSFANGQVRLSGRQVDILPAPGEANDPAGPWYNRVCGCNCAFRAEALAATGGFDERFAFAYDETDVCLGLIRAGWRVVHAPAAEVEHGFAPGAFRRSEWDRDWRTEIRSQVLFGVKNRHSTATALRCLARSAGRVVFLAGRLLAEAARGRMGWGRAMALTSGAATGWFEGTGRGGASRA